MLFATDVIVCVIAVIVFDVCDFIDMAASIATVADYTLLRQSIQVLRRPLFFPLKKILTESKDTF